jgi:putative glutamine amidotransferase
MSVSPGRPDPQPAAASPMNSATLSRQPVVLVPACNRMLGQHPFHVAGQKYVDAVRLAGCLPLVVPSASPQELAQLLDLADGVLLTGSPSNVHPSHYGEEVYDQTLPLDPVRDDWTLPLIPQLLQRSMPLLAICRGFAGNQCRTGRQRCYQAVHEVDGHQDHRAPADAPAAEVQYGAAHDRSGAAWRPAGRIWFGGATASRSIQRAWPGREPAGRWAAGGSARSPDGVVEAFSIDSESTGFTLLCVSSGIPNGLRPTTQFRVTHAHRVRRSLPELPRQGTAAPKPLTACGARRAPHTDVFHSGAEAAPSPERWGVEPARIDNEKQVPAMAIANNISISAELEQWLNERRVTEIECLVPDLTGVARGKILPRQKFTEDRGMRLPEAIVGMGVTGEFPEEGPYYDVINPTDRDMHLRPDPPRCASCPGPPTPRRRSSTTASTMRASSCPLRRARCCAASVTSMRPRAGSRGGPGAGVLPGRAATPTPTRR